MSSDEKVGVEIWYKDGTRQGQLESQNDEVAASLEQEMLALVTSGSGAQNAGQGGIFRPQGGLSDKEVNLVNAIPVILPDGAPPFDAMPQGGGMQYIYGKAMQVDRNVPSAILPAHARRMGGEGMKTTLALVRVHRIRRAKDRSVDSASNLYPVTVKFDTTGQTITIAQFQKLGIPVAENREVDPETGDVQFSYYRARDGKAV